MSTKDQCPLKKNLRFYVSSRWVHKFTRYMSYWIFNVCNLDENINHLSDKYKNTIELSISKKFYSYFFNEINKAKKIQLSHSSIYHPYPFAHHIKKYMQICLNDRKNNFLHKFFDWNEFSFLSHAKILASINKIFLPLRNVTSVKKIIFEILIRGEKKSCGSPSKTKINSDISLCINHFIIIIFFLAIIFHRCLLW